MSSTTKRIIQWTYLSLLLAIGALSAYAGRYDLALNFARCTMAAVLVERAARARQYVWACGFAGLAIAVSPLLLVDRIFLMLGFTSIVSSLGAISAFRPRPVVAF